MFKNVASQKITFLVIDTATNLPKTGDAANLTAYVSIDDGVVTVLTDTSASELDATNAPGLYSFDLTQAETNGDKLVFSGKSSTSGVRVVPMPIYTLPANFTGLSISGGVAQADVRQLLGTAWLTPAVAGTPDVNAKQVGGTAWASADLSATMKASVNTEADTALTDYGALKPTVAGRTLDVSVGGEAGIDWANIGSPTTSVALTGTTLTLVNGSITSSTFAADAITASVIAVDAIGASELAADAVAEIADAVWDEVLSGHLTAGTTGAGLNAAGSAGDPWTTSLPGAYAAGSAGYLVGTYLDAAMSSRSTYAGADTAGTTTLLSRLTATRAGYLDNLSGGAVALASGVTVTSMGTGVITATSIAPDAIGASELASDAVTEIANAVSSALSSGVTVAAMNSNVITASALDASATTEIVHGVWDEDVGTHILPGSTGLWLSGIKTDTTTLLSRITNTLFSGITSLAQWLGALAGKQTANSTARTEIRATGAGSGTFLETSDSLEAIRDRGDAAWVTGAGGGGTGSGAYAVTVTVDDGTNPLQNASVRFVEGVTDLVGTTDVNGQVQFSVDAATWAVSITKPGYQFTPTTLAVSAADSVIYSMSLTVLAPNPNPDLSNVLITCLDSSGSATSGIVVQVRLTLAPPKLGGMAMDGDWESHTSDANGEIALTLLAFATYEIRRGTNGVIQKFIPNAGAFTVPSFVGRT